MDTVIPEGEMGKQNGQQVLNKFKTQQAATLKLKPQESSLWAWRSARQALGCRLTFQIQQVAETAFLPPWLCAWPFPVPVL
jgi:hypothetical protein